MVVSKNVSAGFISRKSEKIWRDFEARSRQKRTLRRRKSGAAPPDGVPSWRAICQRRIHSAGYMWLNDVVAELSGARVAVVGDQNVENNRSLSFGFGWVGRCNE